MFEGKCPVTGNVKSDILVAILATVQELDHVKSNAYMNLERKRIVK